MKSARRVSAPSSAYSTGTRSTRHRDPLPGYTPHAGLTSTMNDQNDAPAACADRHAAGLRDGDEEAFSACEKPVQNSGCNFLVSLDTSLIIASRQRIARASWTLSDESGERWCDVNNAHPLIGHIREVLKRGR